ncbi:5487_t:CDS:2 [Funneliformis geosporum]|uniref:5487_t:CDS:1 n=1 Tax=Funneliformis geosporum TaxID=1117311 RepID=A0A9W4SLT3_9GLOM|nr:5487_t:CDS:2 [Funneliformis geosporum]
MIRYWSSTFFKKDQDSNTEYVLPNSAWAKFLHTIKLCFEQNINTLELTQIGQLFCDFVTHYEREYLQNNPSRLLAILISYHYLLHISASIRNTGPAWATKQYLMKRLCEILLPLMRSKQHLYTNLQK